MSRRPASFTQADIPRTIRAAKQAGAAEVEVRVGNDARIVVRLKSSTAAPNETVEGGREIVL